MHCTDSQSSLEAGKKELDEQKVALRERNKELSRCEQERKEREKEKVSCALKIKELEHKITKFHKDSRDAAQRVRAPITKFSNGHSVIGMMRTYVYNCNVLLAWVSFTLLVLPLEVLGIHCIVSVTHKTAVVRYYAWSNLVSLILFLYLTLCRSSPYSPSTTG